MSELPLDTLISVARAKQILAGIEVAPGCRAANTLADADGAVLAQDVLADRDYPPFDKSLVDGFAARQADFVENSELNIDGHVAAGEQFSGSLRAGQCVKIMTGAPMPDGADSSIPIESTSVSGERVRILQPPRLGQFIARRGTESASGEISLRAGTRIGPAQLACLAQVGCATPAVFNRPRVAILTTGSEIVPADQTPGTAAIRNANAPMLAGLLHHLGCDLVASTHAPDDRQVIAQQIEIASAQAQVVMITGGMSMGDYDFVPKVLPEIGFEILITKLRIKPGKPFVFAVRRRDNCFAVGLPGNPVSGYCCTLVLAAQLLDRLAGLRVPLDRSCIGRLIEPLPANGPREFYQPGILSGTALKPLQWRGSADVFTLARANVLIVREESEPARSAGELLRCLRLPGAS